MKVFSAIVAVVWLWPALAAGQTKPVETTLDGVMVDLVELHQTAGALRLAIHFVNRSEKSVTPPPFAAEQITLTDVTSRKKYFALRDASQQFLAGPIVSAADGGRIGLRLAPKQSAVLWAYFDAIPAAATMTVEVPIVSPIENVPVSQSALSIFAGVSAVSESSGATAVVVSARRSGDSVTVVLKLALDNGAEAPPSTTIDFKRVFLFDPAGKRAYSLMQDKDGVVQAQPLTSKADGGSFTPDWRKPATLDLMFQAPPDSAKSVDLLLPGFLPVVGLAIEPDTKTGKRGK